MTTPAENYYKTGSGAFYRHTYNPTTSSWSVAGPYKSPNFRERLVRPESISSPRREDGTRAPKPYFRRGGVSVMPMARLSSSQDRAGLYKSYMEPYQNVDLIPEVPSTLVFKASVYNRALTNYLDNLKNSKVNLGVALGEARTTARMVSNSATRIARSVRAFRRGNPRKVWEDIRRKENIPNAWLELQYGWNPLLRDVLGSAEALAEAQNQGLRFNLSISGSASERAPYTYEKTQPGAFGVVFNGVDKQHCRIVGNYDLPASILPQLSSLGLTNPLEIAWELVPYSFVVDWFLPIGTWLHGLDAGWGLSFREGSVSRIRRITAVGEMTVDPREAWTYNRSVKPIRAGLLRHYTFQRTLMYSTPWPVLPSLRNPLSLNRMANALSLLAAAFSRRG